MAAKKQPANVDPRQALLQPLAGYRHKTMPLPDSDVKVIVREPDSDDWVIWQAALQELSGEDVTEENADDVAARISAGDDHTPEATLLVRVLINSQTYQRVFSDDDVELVKTSWGPVYDRFISASLGLAGLLTPTPVEDAKKN